MFVRLFVYTFVMFLINKMDLVKQNNITLDKFAKDKSASVKFAPDKYAKVKFAPYKFAPDKYAKVKFA